MSNNMYEKEIKEMTVMTAVFFQRLMENKDVAQEMLRVIVSDDKLIVREVVAERQVHDLYGRSVRLDALCVLGNGKECNIEIQNADDDDHVKRVRYNASLLTANRTIKGSKFAEIPSLLMVYVTSFDLFGLNRNIYHAHMSLTDEGTDNMIVDDGLDVIYVNTAVKDGTTLSELLECFTQQNVDNPKFPCLSREVQRYKNDEQAMDELAEVIEERDVKQRAIGDAMRIVASVENIMEQADFTLEEACNLIKVTLEEYNDSKEILSQICESD